MTAVFRIGEVEPVLRRSRRSPASPSPPRLECHDYPRPYDLADPLAQRRAEYERGLAALDPGQFRPFSASAWLSTDIDAGPKCLDWPVDPTAGSPLRGLRLPDVPVLVQSGDLDTNTPIEQGRPAAAQFRHSIFAVVANAGHTPDLHRCGVAMALDFIRHLKTDPDRCRHAGRPPRVVGRPALRAAQLRAPARARADAVRRAVAVALATLADERALVAYSGLTGTLDALRGGTYVVGQDRVRFVAARVVTDASPTGTEQISRRVTRTRLGCAAPVCRPRSSRSAPRGRRRASPAPSPVNAWLCGSHPHTNPGRCDTPDPRDRASELDEPQASGNDCSHLRFLRNAIVKEAAAPSSFKARERIDLGHETPVVS